MRKYELVCVIQPDLDEVSFNALLEKVKAGSADLAAVLTRLMFGDAASWRTSSRSIAKVSSFY